MEKTGEFKVPPTMGMSDLRREHELALVQLCGNIPVFVTDFPVKSRPFYCADRVRDCVGEVLGGSVRESDSTRLNQSIKRHQLLESSVERLHWYLELRRFGSAPHGGYGLGVDRFLRFLVGGSTSNASSQKRNPKPVRPERKPVDADPNQSDAEPNQSDRQPNGVADGGTQSTPARNPNQSDAETQNQSDTGKPKPAAVPASAVRDRRVALAYSRQLVELSAQLPKSGGADQFSAGAGSLKPTSFDSDLLEFGFAYDCPPVRGAFDIASLVCRGNCGCGPRPVSWTVSTWPSTGLGGWHHAKRDEASGFCYINDIVYGVLELKKRYDRVMYIDLDLHHGDGVEEAFYYSAGILTGLLAAMRRDSDDMRRRGPGRFASVNVPLKEGVSDAQFAASFAAVD
uniref:histone deacetylase n=1 Tax=Macrostomum lignano TaxID=282301 RepID=A0A1I8JQ81_9PLAT